MSRSRFFSPRSSFDSVIDRLATPCQIVLIALLAMTAGSSPAMAQTPAAEVGGHVGVLRLSELKTTDVGAGADVVWPVAPSLAIDGGLTWFPGSDASTGSSQHLQRTLGLAGVRTGVTAGTVDLFARARGGFLRFGSQPVTACILIFPPPLSCQLAAGYTAFAAEVGGGASVGVIPSGRLRATLAAGDLMVRYGFTAFRPGGTTTDGFISHNLLVTIGAAWRF
jgi:hypothetical protein